MSPKILRRCTICKKFHASYLVEDTEFGKCYLCYSCWKSRLSEGKAIDKKPEGTQEKIEISQKSGSRTKHDLPDYPDNVPDEEQRDPHQRES